MRRLLIVACLIVFLDVAFFEAITPLLGYYRAEHGLGEGQAGVLVGSFAVGSVLLSLPIGFVAARFGARRVILVGLVIFCLSAGAFGFADSYEALVATRFIQGAAGAALWAGALSWLMAATPIGRRGAVVGVALGMAVVGALIGPLFGALAVEIGTEPVFSAVFVASAALIVAVLTIPDATLRATNPVPEVMRIMVSRRIIASAAMVFVPSVMFGLAAVLVPLRVDDLGGSALLIALGFAAGGATEAVLSPIMGRFSDRHGRLLPFLIGSIVGALAIVLIATESIPLVLGALIAISVAAGASFAPGYSRLADSADLAGLHQGLSAALANMAWAAGQIVGAVGSGALAELAGPLVPCLVVSAVLLAAAGGARRQMRIEAAG